MKGITNYPGQGHNLLNAPYQLVTKPQPFTFKIVQN